MPRVLVVDDEAPIRALLADILEIDGYTVSQAASAAGALRELSHQSPDLMILDFMLPDGDGATVARLCNATRDAPIPIMLISAVPYASVVAEQMVQFGVQAFTSKPFDLDALLASVARLARPVVDSAALRSHVSTPSLLASVA
jgi:DNA-binding response OmpR family regulator